MKCDPGVWHSRSAILKPHAFRATETPVTASENVRPIFVMSSPRAGSTLLRRLIDTHPSICAPAELRLGGMCEYFMTALEVTLGDGTIERKPLSRAACTARIRKVMDEWLGEYCRLHDKKRWCDKTPLNIENIVYLRAVFPDAQWICLHREPRDVVSSLLEVQYWPLKRHECQPDVIAMLIAQWCRTTERLLALENTLGADVMRMTYESLVTNPASELRRLWRFLDVDPEDGMADEAFVVRHSEGPGDHNVAWMNGVRRDRVGRGSWIDMAATPATVQRRLETLAASLGYQCV